MDPSVTSVGAISLTAIGITVAATGIILLGSFIGLGFAIRFQSKAIAPRLAGRPKETIYNKYPTHKSQIRGNPFYGWIGWLLKFDYVTLLKGVPGTGTRSEGLSGKNINLNLDAIIMLRFNALCLRIAFLTCILAIGIVLPINITAAVDDSVITFNDTTLAAIPTLLAPKPSPTLITKPVTYFQKLGENLVHDFPNQMRLYAIILCCWILTYYLCNELAIEWKDNLALRRNYYFEADIYHDRKMQLKKIDKGDGFDLFKKKRNPWVRDPELRDTVPNVELYSILVGNVPCLPPTIVDDNDPEAKIAFTEQEKIDWQLAVATAFFDSCVPNQPGFSSSVAAITILPDANQLADAWTQWSKAASALRRLRFVRSILAQRKMNDVQMEGTGEDISKSVENIPKPESSSTLNRNIFLSDHNSTAFISDNDLTTEEKITQILEYNNLDVENQLMEALNYGPEQTDAYSKEFANAATGLFPYGFGAEKFRNLSTDELKEMELKAFRKVERANAALQEAQTLLLTTEKSDKKFGIIKRRRSSISDADGISDSESEASLDFDPLQISTYLTNSIGKIFKRSFSFKSLKIEEAMQEVVGPLVTSSRNLSCRFDDETKEKEEENTEALQVLRNSGDWSIPTKPLRAFGNCIKKNTFHNVTDAVNDFNYHPTFAVVTFTNRQAAVSARQCLTDGRGGKHWTPLDDIPVPPLADSAPLDCFGRGMWKPVTLSIPRQQQVCRNWSKNVLLILINLFYTLPLTIIANLAKNWTLFVPQDVQDKYDIDATLSGIVYAFFYALFVSICPYMFKAIANFGSNEPSLSAVELSAMQYYWIFILVTSFSSTVIVTSFLNAWDQGDIAPDIYSVLQNIANTIPVQISYNWINNIIYRYGLTLPFFYLLQGNVIICYLLRLKFLARMISGGMIPYRIYIDTGTVFLCVVTLSLACPLVAPFGTIFFMVNEIMLRRNFVFVYKPEYDGGGFRWPFLSDMCFSSILLAQVLLTVMVFLKGALGPTFFAALTIVPTIAYRKLIYGTYRRAYIDTALLQTAYLDMWGIDSADPTSFTKREDFRKFLVDAHRAAYIPVCIAGSTTSILTSEPAIVVPLESDSDAGLDENGHSSQASTFDNPLSNGQKIRKGVALRRVGKQRPELSRGPNSRVLQRPKRS